MDVELGHSRTIELGAGPGAMSPSHRTGGSPPRVRLAAWAGGLPWVFSLKRDLLLLALPLIATLVLLLLDSAFDVGSVNLGSRTLFTLTFAVMTFMDTGHLLSTIFRSYLDAQVRRQHRTLLYLGPFVVIVANVLIERAFGLKYVVYLFAYLNVYHLMRQQYGWVAITARKAGERSGSGALLDKCVVYALFIFPTAWVHFSLPPSERRIAFPADATVAHAALYGFSASLCFYTTWRVYDWVRHRRVNIPKLVVVGSTALIWGGVMFLRSRFWPLVSTVYHAVPYVGLIFLSARARSTNRFLWERLWHWRYGALLFGVAIFAVGYSLTQTMKVFSGVALQQTAGFSVVCIANVLPLMHYLIDGVIWRRGAFNPSAET